MRSLPGLLRSNYWKIIFLHKSLGLEIYSVGGMFVRPKQDRNEALKDMQGRAIVPPCKNALSSAPEFKAVVLQDNFRLQKKPVILGTNHIGHRN